MKNLNSILFLSAFLTTNLCQAAFPDKTQLLKLIMRDDTTHLSDGRLASDALAQELAEHQNPDPGVRFHAVCQDAFVSSGSSDFTAPCRYEVFRTWRHGNQTKTTYTVLVHSSSVDGSNPSIANISRVQEDYEE